MKELICTQCGEPYYVEIELFKRLTNESGICPSCDRKNFEDSIDYDED